MPALDVAWTALIVIDPQNWTLGVPITPHAADQIVANRLRYDTEPINFVKL